MDDYSPHSTQIQAAAPAREADNLAAALAHAARGWYIFPCRPDKRPYTQHGKDDASTDPDQVRIWWQRWPDALIGVYCEKSGFFALDIDNKNGKDGSSSWAELVRIHGAGQDVPAGPIQSTPSGGFHVLFRLPEGLSIPNNSDKLGSGLDLRSNGYICTGGPYTWLPDHGLDSQLTNAPAWLLEVVRNLGVRREQDPAPAEPFRSNGASDPGEYWLKKALDRANPGNRNDTGFWLACQLRDAGLSESEAEHFVNTYSHKVPGGDYTEKEALASLREAYKAPPREPARALGFTISTNGNGHHAGGPPPEPPGEEGQALALVDDRILLTDMGNARRYAMQHGARLRYVKRGWGWTVWTGKRWEQDETGRAVAMAKQTAKGIYREAETALDGAKAAIRAVEQAAEQGDEDKKQAAIDTQKKAEKLANSLLAWALKSQSRPRLEAMIALAESEPEIAARAGDFDGAPWSLNCQNGILDLRTGELRPHNPRAMITRLAGAEFAPAASCPTWDAFLNKVFSGNQAIISFIQRAVGYSLTGNTGEQCLFFLYGTGKNGKSTFTGALQALLGDYSSKTLTDTLMAKHFDGGINNDLARLAGARAVVAAELAEGRRLNESLVKDLTGGDTITARYLRQEFFEFTPAFKLWMYGNHKPIIRGTDEGIWRRMKLVPFTVTIPEGERDPDLPEKLRAELPGILAWAVAGCLLWQQDGLQTPKEVDAATAEYRAEQDSLAAFIQECLVTGPGCKVNAKDLYDAYKDWGGELPTQRRFSQAMAERGYTTQGRDKNGRALYPGIGLLSPQPEEKTEV